MTDAILVNGSEGLSRIRYGVREQELLVCCVLLGEGEQTTDGEKRMGRKVALQ
jgi:hypothetical protein